MARAIVRFLGLLFFTTVFRVPSAPAEIPLVGSAQLTGKLPLPFDDAADAHAQVAAAAERAKAGHKYVLLDFGANWCADCRVLSAVLALPQVEPAIARTFEVVLIDVGRLRRNLDIAERYGAQVKAVPTIVILDPDGLPVRMDNPAALSDAHVMEPQAIVDTVYGWIGQHRPG